MRKKLINKKQAPKICENCIHGRPLPDDETMLCEKSGIRRRDSSCGKFRYNPLNRIPKKDPVLMEFSNEDFEL